MKHSLTVSVIATSVFGFLLNLIWENMHAGLYTHYRGGEITELILLRAALFDGIVISILYLAARRLIRRYRFALFVFFAVVFAAGLELFALESGRWAYTDAMPVVPLIGVGASPLAQLAITGIISIAAAEYFVTKYGVQKINA